MSIGSCCARDASFSPIPAPRGFPCAKSRFARASIRACSIITSAARSNSSGGSCSSSTMKCSPVLSLPPARARPKTQKIMRAFTVVAAIGAMLALPACSDSPPPGYPGYVEADYVRVAAPLSGTLARLSVNRGDEVAANAPLFTLESVQEAAARAEAEARVRQAEATLADLEKTKRPPEIAAVRAQLAQAQAALKQSE